MIGLIIATHGNSSVELIKGAEMFAGPLSQCRAWTLNPGMIFKRGADVRRIRRRIRSRRRSLDHGRSVWRNTFQPGNKNCLRRENVETVTGVNLPMIIQFVTERETQTLDELVESCIETAQDGIK
mgnify:CR=1 FL=1